MASYARTPAQQTKNQMSVLAQAKPAIISTAPSSYNIPTGILSEKINTTLKLSSSSLSASSHQERDILAKSLNYDHPKVRHIEDDNVIQKQNASNQMRQAAVMAAVASQQKVRLSATERLALTAKRPTTDQQIHQNSHHQKYQTNHYQQNQKPQVPSSKPAPMPTLETLLAVQRQLQQHTKQHLTSVPQKVVTTINNNHNNNDHDNKQETVCDLTSTRQRNKPLPPSPPKSPPIIEHDISSQDSYDKDLPPLPPSISPSTSTDDSQMNSLDSSHQSSPATSLVSIPPPPPPISSYLEQYDEVNSCHQSIQSNSSTPSMTSSSDVSSVIKQFSPLQVKSVNSTASSNHQSPSFELPLPYKNQSPSSYDQNRLPTLATKPPLLNYMQQAPTTTATTPVQQNNYYAAPVQQKNEQLNNNNNNIYSINRQQQLQQHSQQQVKPPQLPPQPPQLHRPTQTATNNNQAVQNYGNNVLYKPQINYQQHLFTLQTSCSSPFLSPPPPPPPLLPTTTNDGSLDEPDSGSFRFPTPPPPDLLLDEEEEDDDFQCKIPTPPPHKSMSAASFQDLHCHHQQQLKQSSPPIFNSSTFSVSTANGLQPPPLFRRQTLSAKSVPPSVSAVAPLPPPPLPPPQLTVHINNEGGLLSTANSNHQTVNHHHHHIMMTMTASSSSPSSSSDGDGQSSNSSSSTSGIHSSIDSPSSSNSKLDDFNYSGKLKKQLATNHESPTSSSSSTSPSQNMATSLQQTANSVTTTARRPALKQKKTVSFSDKVELVACADEQSEDHLPNPLLARVLAGKLQ